MWYLIEGMVLGCSEFSAKHSETTATTLLQMSARSEDYNYHFTMILPLMPHYTAKCCYSCR